MRRTVLAGLVSAFMAVPAGAQSPSAEGLDVRIGVKIPMRDGVRLNGTLYHPRGGPARRPVILAMTPYISDRYHGYVLPIAKRGYVVAVVDVRGRGSSEGTFRPFEQEAKDGYDTVEWLASQPWSDGQVAMMGGSYGGFNQWSIAKEMPPHLVTITPTASAHLGIDFPGLGGIGYSYLMQWLTFTSGNTGNGNLFGDGGYWRDKFRQAYLAQAPYASLDSVVGWRSEAFQTWVRHPDYDDYWASMAPSPEVLAKLSIPIFTRTGIYDGDQIGAMEHYRNHMKHGNPDAKARHYLMIGPWDHAGTRTPQRKFGGLEFGEASVFDMGELEADWFDWTMKKGTRPARLPKRVAYYVTGAEEWKYADALDELGRNPTRFYLTSEGGGASDLYRSGMLATAEPAASAPDRWSYDPLDTAPGTHEGDPPDLADPSLAVSLAGNGVVYHTAPFQRDTEITGFPALELWLTLNVPDTDLWASIYEITRDGRSIQLDDVQLRARYRESRRQPKLVTPGEPTRFVIDGFRFMSRRVARGSRIRLLVMSLNSIHWEKNYNSGKAVAFETANDARAATIQLHHEPGRWSALSLPIVR